MRIHIFSDRLKPAGRCIYCGSCERLEIEHIIPFGLWGRIEFPDASCRTCAEKINIFETQVQRDHLGAFRQRAKIPLRKRRPRKYKYQLSFGRKQGDPPAPQPIEISGDEVPRSILLMRFLPPQVFIGKWPRSPEIWYYQNTADINEIMEKYPSHAVFVGSYDNNMFCRLLAKIGHGLTVAYMPPQIIDTFQMLLPNLILNGSENYHALIGGDFTVPAATSLMHEWNISNAVRGDTEFLFARIRLFACLGTPQYNVVVASRPLGPRTVTKDPVRFPP